ncbi:hypothetical protein [Streptomyces yangpuensis]|uniref:hypothetical protein n=1 Tax=Streptomyces yangpuensis TaxID=1648182 RepID=UPI0036CC955F
MYKEADARFIRQYDALPMEERAAFRRAHGELRGLRVRIRDLGPMRSAAYGQLAEDPSVEPTLFGRERTVPRRIRSTCTPRRGRPGTYEQRRTFTVNDRDGEPVILDITIVIRGR